jgi:hypothetical protein
LHPRSHHQRKIYRRNFIVVIPDETGTLGKKVMVDAP